MSIEWTRVTSQGMKSHTALLDLTQHGLGCPVSAASFCSMLQKAQRPSDRRPP
jgi:hypothetical protein